MTARAQDEPPQATGRGQFAGMQRVSGEVTAVSADKLTIKAEDGTIYQVVTTPNTRLVKQGGAAFKVTDLKPGDGVMSAGNLDAPNKTLHAAMLVAVDAEQVKKMAEARKQAQANMGKTLIAGRVTAIDLDNAKMTVERGDKVSQTIAFDETTSFRRGAPGRMSPEEAGFIGGFGVNMRQGGNGAGAQAPPVDAGESITLADIKVGDNVSGPGSLKNGVFVPTQLTVRTPRTGGGRRQGGNGAGPGAAGTPEPQGPPKQ
ncbi:MAG TPA: hypothetical protein VGN16_11390 [Acidobacteriaceae bacterium]